AIWLLRGRDGSFLVSCERGILASVSGSRWWLMPLTAEVPPRDRAVLLAGPAGPAPAPGAGFTRWIRAWRRIGCTGTCRIYCGTRIRRGLCGDAAAAGYGDAGFIPCLIQPGMMRPGTAGLRGRSGFCGRSG